MAPIPSSASLAQDFFQPLNLVLAQCNATRVCPALPDQEWFHLLVTRVLHEVKSGRAFLQEFAGRFPVCPTPSNFFESHKSTRRLALVKELNERLQVVLRASMADRFAAYPQLANFELYAGDGHFHGAAVHDPKVEELKHATGHFYGLNLRHSGMIHLSSADTQQRLKEHDMRALKRLDIQVLRQGAPKGRKVLWVYDRAGIDFAQWQRWKQGSGIYFISRTKENMVLEVIGQPSWQLKEPINQGVTANDWVSTSQGVMVRRVGYRDPVSGEFFEFLTSELDLPPGLIAHLYRLRWDIEKQFDEFKNKLAEKKSWASTPTAKTIHAQLLCLTHALLVLFEAKVMALGVTNVAEDARRQKRLEQTETSLERSGEKLPSALRALVRCTQHSVKFIRWLRSIFFLKTSWVAALERLRQLYAKL